MKTWEYKTFKNHDTSDLEGVLNVLGKEGWELTTICDNWVFLKREVQPTSSGEEEDECTGEWSCGCSMCSLPKTS